MFCLLFLSYQVLSGNIEGVNAFSSHYQVPLDGGACGWVSLFQFPFFFCQGCLSGGSPESFTCSNYPRCHVVVRGRLRGLDIHHEFSNNFNELLEFQ